MTTRSRGITAPGATNHLPTKAGWRVSEWAADVSRAFVYELLSHKKIASGNAGGARIITTRPADYLASLPSA